MFDLLIRNGLLVTPEATFAADIAVSGEKIAALGAPGTFDGAADDYDAAGKYVLPGLIDPHVHMSHPFQGELSADDFQTTTIAAAHGGVTTLIDFAIQWDKSKTIAEIIELRRRQIAGQAVVDFGLHGVPTKSNEETLRGVAQARPLGVPSFKVYMVYRQQGRMVDDAVLSGLLKEMRRHDGLLLVHAENVSIAEFNQEAFLARGHTGAAYFPRYKPNLVEAEAVNRALYFNRMADSQLYIVHLSTREGIGLLKCAQANGERAYAETCTHYLVLNEDVYEHPDGHHFICSPPLRSQVDVDALWCAVSDGSISIISSDHCGFDLRQKNLGNGNFSKTPNGLPGVETRLPVIYTEGVHKGRITLNRMVAATSTNVAKTFGLYPRKGTIQPGSDADLVVLDTEQERVLEAQHLHGAAGWTPFAGMKIRGFAQTTILRGRFVVRDGAFVGSKGYGTYLARC